MGAPSSPAVPPGPGRCQGGRRTMWFGGLRDSEPAPASPRCQAELPTTSVSCRENVAAACPFRRLIITVSDNRPPSSPRGRTGREGRPRLRSRYAFDGAALRSSARSANDLARVDLLGRVVGANGEVCQALRHRRLHHQSGAPGFHRSQTFGLQVRARKCAAARSQAGLLRKPIDVAIVGGCSEISCLPFRMRDKGSEILLTATGRKHTCRGGSRPPTGALLF